MSATFNVIRQRGLRQALRAAVWYPAPEGVNAALAWTGLGLAGAAPTMLVLPVGPLVKCLVLLAFMSFGPGCALLCHVRLGSAVASWAMALVLSLSLAAVSSSVMVWTAWWHPEWMLWGLSLLSLASAVSCVAPILLGVAPPQRPEATGAENVNSTQLMSRVSDADSTQVMARIPEGDATQVMSRIRDDDATQVMSRVRDGDATTILPRPANRAAAGSGAAPSPVVTAGEARWSTAASIAGVCLLVAGTASWVVSLLLSSTAGVGDYGLLSVMHPTFFVAVGLCALGFLIEVSRDRRRGWLLVGYLVLVLLLLHATVPILVREPEYAWTYKHIGVIELFRTTGRIQNPKDIYQAWPSLFASVAQLVTLSGASSLRVAAWAPLFFDAADCLPLFAIVRSLTNDRRLPYLTVFVFTCVNWVAQDYLSPQAFAYVLCLGAALILLRWLRGRATYSSVRPRSLGRLWAWLHLGLVVEPYPSKRTRHTALACLYLVYAAVVITHQLSPYLVALSATALVALGLVRSWQVVPILLGIAVLYLLPNYGAVDEYGLFDGLNIFSTFLHSAQGAGPASTFFTAGRVFSGQAVQLLSVVLWGGAVLAVLTSRKRVGPVAAPATLAFAPFALLFGQGYGGEAIYRVYLFSAPWCAYLVVTMVLRARWMPKVAGLVAGALVLSAATLASVQGAHGQLEFDQFSPEDVRALQYTLTQAPKGSTVIAASDNLPDRLTANYGDFNGGFDLDTLTDIFPELAGPVTPQQMVDINTYCGEIKGQVFLVFANSMNSYAHYFGYLPDGTLTTLQAAIASSPDWTVYYPGTSTVVYRFTSQPAG